MKTVLTVLCALVSVSLFSQVNAFGSSFAPQEPLDSLINLNYHCYKWITKDGTVRHDMDIDGNGYVNVADLLRVINRWGTPYTAEDMVALIAQFNGPSEPIDDPNLSLFRGLIFSSGVIAFVPDTLEAFVFETRVESFPQQEDLIGQYSQGDEPNSVFDCPDPYEACPLSWYCFLYMESGIERFEYCTR